jgi:hypothetical protein
MVRKSASDWERGMHWLGKKGASDSGRKKCNRSRRKNASDRTSDYLKGRKPENESLEIFS